LVHYPLLLLIIANVLTTVNGEKLEQILFCKYQGSWVIGAGRSHKEVKGRLAVAELKGLVSADVYRSVKKDY